MMTTVQAARGSRDSTRSKARSKEPSDGVGDDG